MNNKKGFSLIELMVAIFIFAVGILSVFTLVISTLNLNEFNKNYLIAASLAREQVELVRNIRDSNYNKIQIFNQIDPSSDNHQNVFLTGAYYRIENDFSSNAPFPVIVKEIKDFTHLEGKYISDMNEYKVCLDSNNLYKYLNMNNSGKNDITSDCESRNMKNTVFYKYIAIDEVTYMENGTRVVMPDAFKVTSKVIWISKGFKEFEITSIFTDYKRY